ncbi:MAG: phosphate-starvation-inducible PsiE family protein [Rhodocyclaceae bacterium]|nr:phosphate-starvation-inducible PsiE family protein [Rhodocyclaceae bacterium]
MDSESHGSPRMIRLARGGLDGIEYAGLLVIAIATTVAMSQEVMLMVGLRQVRLGDLLLMFLYLEVLAMVGQYFKMGQLPVRFPLYIAMVALARYLILDVKEMNEWRIFSVTAAILLLTLAVLALRYGHVRLAYSEDPAEGAGRPG